MKYEIILLEQDAGSPELSCTVPKWLQLSFINARCYCLVSAWRRPMPLELSCLAVAVQAGFIA